MNNVLTQEFEKIYNLIDFGKLKNKSLIVTGANGLIGSYIIYLLVFLNRNYNANIQIYALSRNKTRLCQKFENVLNDINIIEQDLNNSFKLEIKPDYIIHAASNAHPRAYSTDPVGTMKTNLLGTINLLESIIDTSCKFLYISTGEIYGNNVDHAFTENDLGIVDTKEVRACYPESKRAAETLCMAYSEQYNININIARLCYVYGPTITDSNSRADAQFLRNAIDGENIIMKSEGKQKRTYCYVADAASAILYILLNGINKEVYNIANPNSIVSVREYAQTLCNVSGVNLKFELPDDIEKRGFSKPADSILDSTKLQNIGWKPMYDINTGLKNTYEIKKELEYE